LKVDQLLRVQDEDRGVVRFLVLRGGDRLADQVQRELDLILVHADHHRRAAFAEEPPGAAQLRYAKARVEQHGAQPLFAVTAQDRKDEFLFHICSNRSTFSTNTVAPPTSTSTKAPIIAADSTMLGPAGINRVRRSQ